MSKKNMVIWDLVCISNPKTLKKLNYGFKPTVIDAQSQLKRATEIFGPMGIGWGIEKESRHFEDGRLFYSAILWYKWDGETGAVAICSDVDIKNDCMKSSQTDALTKGLSRIGFNSDVFEGTYDGNKYVEPQTPTRKKNGSMSDVAHEEEQQSDGSEGVDLEKEMTYDSKTDKVKYGYPSIRSKTYNDCTKKELSDNHDHFGPITDESSPDMCKHLNTIEAELSLRESK